MTDSSAPATYTPFPDPGTPENPLKYDVAAKFLDNRLDPTTTYRLAHIQEYTLNKAYVESIQWVKPGFGSQDPQRASRFQETDPQRRIPKPITNEILPIFDSAVSRMGQRQSKPSIRARNTSAATRAGAARAQSILEHHFDVELQWPQIRRQGIYRQVLYGTGIWKSYWDLDYLDLVRVGVETAMACAAPCALCGGTGKGPGMDPLTGLAAPGEALGAGLDAATSAVTAPGSLGQPSGVPTAKPAGGSTGGAGGASPPPPTPSFRPDQPPFPTRNTGNGLPSDMTSADDESIAGSSTAAADKGGTPPGKPKLPPVFAQDLLGPRTKPSTPPAGPHKFSITNPDPIDPGADYSDAVIQPLDPMIFDCPGCDGTGQSGCGTSVASTDISPAHVLKLKSFTGVGRQVAPGEKGEYTYSFKSCPTCGGPMKPYDVAPDELHSTDMLGRPLGQDIPRGSAKVEAVSPYDWYVENEGIDRGPGNCDEFYQQTPRSLDWLAQHYENTEGIKAEDPAKIAQQHPILGEYSLWVGGSRIAGERNVYQNHVRVREAYKLRSKRFPLGRALITAGKQILLDDDLFFESPDIPGKFIPRVQYFAARYFRKDGEFLGQGIVTPLVSLQNRINMTSSQMIDTRERHATPGILATRGMRFSAAWLAGHAGRFLLWDVDSQNPEQKPEIFETKVLNELMPEIEYCGDRMRDIAGEKDVDQGDAPGNVSAASGIQLLQEKSAIRNAEREAELKDAFVGVYTHQMELLRNFVREPRSYMKKEGSSWEEAEYLGLDLANQTDVVVEDDAAYDQRLFNREGIIQGVSMGLYNIGDPVGKRETLKAMGLPLSPNDQENVQIDDAERKWFGFRDNGYVPVVDEFEDDHLIHWVLYGKFLKGPDGTRVRSEADWDNVNKILCGWNQKLTQAQTTNEAVIAAQSPQPTQGPLGMIPPKPPAPPPPGFPLPTALQDQILTVWIQMLSANGYQFPLNPELLGNCPSAVTGQPLQNIPFLNAQAKKSALPPQPGQAPASPPPQLPPAPRPSGVLAFMAACHAHRILYEQKQAMAQAGAPQAAAPGGHATTTGNIAHPAAAAAGAAGGVPSAPSAPGAGAGGGLPA
jgi:hypothetical protein